ncbi:TIGR03000 domain-containing protein [Bremerella alba]|uniref:TIGR03000 domain-containing protein n=1 Tax=Bremerella alba TaxID=980252 RepID=A0A7V8V6I4_9BACT|nr:TIGR03000 domain-containing protein [Bremerella alba]MBA2115855.1 hypothetical protein [Bremerella alba]
MKSSIGRKFAWAGALACAAMVMGTSQAEAGWGSWGSSGGSSGGSSSSSWSASSGGSSGSSGASSGNWRGGIFQRWWDNHRADKVYGSSGGSSSSSYGSSGGSSSSSWGSSGGSSGGGLFGHHRVKRSWGSSGGSSGGSSSSSYGSSGASSGGSSGGSSATYQYYTPSESAPAVDVPADVPPAIPAESASYHGNDAVINVNVPAGATIYVNDKVTSSTGTIRRFVSRDLEPGYKFEYEVRAEMRVDGRLVREVKKLQMTAGEAKELEFQLDPETKPETQVVGAPVETKVTLNVPANASVTLAGNEMRTLGAQRVFSTVALATGETWKDYDIVVTVLRNGTPITQRKVIDLTGGEEMQINFDFNADSVASL